MTDAEFAGWLKTATPNQMMDLLERLQRENPDDYWRVKRYVLKWSKKYLEAQSVLAAVRATVEQGE